MRASSPTTWITNAEGISPTGQVPARRVPVGAIRRFARVSREVRIECHCRRWYNGSGFGRIYNKGNVIDMNNTQIAKLKILTAMFFYGTIGIFVKYVDLPSSVISLARAVIGLAFMLALTFVTKKKLRREAIAKNKWRLLYSGFCVGANWVLLFEAYRYTTVATATLCYYLAPVVTTLGAPFVLKEKLTPRRFACVLAALLGMVLVSGVLNGSAAGPENWKGVVLGLAAAVLYGTAVLNNKLLTDIDSTEISVSQLVVAGAILLPYTLLTVDAGSLHFGGLVIPILLILGIVHTGIAYNMVFSAIPHVKAQTMALYSYLDPVVAVILSALVLKEPLTWQQLVGGSLILGFTLLNELDIGN